MTNGKATMVPASCPECEIGSFTRNHYFTGKLLVERDFRQEQNYYVDKLRLHAQRLHGWGVVCGLKVKQHDNPACRDRYVCLEPGYALDCCGHDILVPEQDCIDLTQLDAIKLLVSKNDTSPRTLQICIRYRECPSEPIPVLYDDCGCDDTQCAPNRILESYEIDVKVVDPKSMSASPESPSLSWSSSINVAHASAVAYHDATRRLYVLTDDPQGFVYQVSTDNYALISSHSLGAHGLTLSVSSDGSRVYVIAEGANPGDARKLHVLDTTQAGLPLIQDNPIDIAGSANSEVMLAVAPEADDRLLALIAGSGTLLRWEIDINTSKTPEDPTTISAGIGANLQSFVLGTDGLHAYFGGADNTTKVLVLATPPATSIHVLPAGAASTAMALVQSSSGDMLAVVDQSQNLLYLVNPSSPSLVGTVTLDHPPVALAISPDNRWAYVVEQDAGKSYLETVDLVSLQLGNGVMPGTALPLGAHSLSPAISTSGQTLYVPYTGDLANAVDGGVAVVDVTDSGCCSKIWDSLNGCNTCETPNCVVLATIKDFVIGDDFEDQTDPPSDPATDLTNHVSHIDNRTGRRLLPSSSTLAEIVQCLCAQGGGGKGQKGDPGLPGAPGKDGAPGTNGTNGTNGKDGQGLEQGLTQIIWLSWTHNSKSMMSSVQMTPASAGMKPAIVIQFSNPVHVSGSPVGTNPIDSQHVFQVLAEDDPGRNKELGLFCHCPVQGIVVPVKKNPQPGPGSAPFVEIPPGDSDFVAFVFANPLAFRHVEGSSDVWVKLHCDFVIDVNGKAVDGPFLRAQLPTGDHMGKFPNPPVANPFGLQGGLFESWFTLGQQ